MNQTTHLSMPANKDIQAWMIGRIAAELCVSPEGIKADESFSHYGLDSLTRFVLAGELAERLSADVSPTIMWECSTIEQVVEKLSEAGEEDRDLSDPYSAQVVPLHSGGSEAPVICVAGIDLYADLARHLAPERPVYGVYVPAEIDKLNPLDSEQIEPGCTVEELADSYVEAIQSIGRAGPYHLAGLSFGGILAFEIAQRLRCTDTEVGVVMLLDSILPCAVKRQPLRRAYHLFRQSVRLGPQVVAKRLRRRMRLSNNRVGNIVGRVIPARNGSINETEHISAIRLKYFWEMSKRYEPRQYDGRVALFRADQRELFGVGFKVDAHCGWQEFVTQELSVHDVPGSHIGIVQEPSVEILARQMYDVISASESTSDRKPV